MCVHAYMHMCLCVRHIFVKARMSMVYIMNLIITHSLEEKLKLNKSKNVVKPSE